MHVPEGMLKGDRAIDPHFKPDELLFRRIHPEAVHYDRKGRFAVPMDQVPLPDMSVNREKFTEDVAWVLFDVVHSRYYSDWGVFGFPVGAIPPAMPICSGGQCDITVEHDPHRKNYAHSQVVVHVAGERIIQRSDVPPEAQLLFRSRLRWQCSLVKLPGAPTT